MSTTTSWCIVALPEEGHPVYEVSSEKKPHMTILFLGEQSEPALAIRIIEAIQHIMKTSFSKKFSLGVEYRGTLGEDQADVLFFYKDETGTVKDFRSLLLKNDDVKTCYDSTFQYPEWTPHLTLGYPDRPAKPLPAGSNSMISWVTFDRISLWLEDSDGPEFRLASYDATAEAVVHAERVSKMMNIGLEALAPRDYELMHYGVKDRDNVLIQTLYAGDTYRTLTTGSEFVSQVSKGRAFDVTLTEVYAIKTSDDGPYQMTGDRNVYQKTKRRK